MISLPFIKVDANVDMEVFVVIMLDVFARLNVAMVAAAAAAAATLREVLILFCLL